MIRAFLIDRDERFVRQFAEQLEQTGEIVVVGHSTRGEQALQQIQRLKPDALFLDIHLPGMSGMELVQRVRENGDLFVVYVTGDKHLAIEAFSQKATDYLLKPVDEDRLHRAADRLRRLNNQ
ncbi:LytR/AlgR family response regulator transcription factor [Paenibacillus nanensis]|uniref:LytR/AlgR family response regulator transcription factor n=1 Tax=Paenibacillus nanensis TaxID=393251 RepID=UPI0013C2DAB6|nr:response regulator [Paenibacillus nanensis]